MGRNARTTKIAPVAIATARAATPVTSISDAAMEKVVFGMVPARPHSRLPRPSTVTVPCTARKSTGRCRRHETRCRAMLLVIDRIESITAVSRKAGSSAQKTGPKSRSKPGIATSGSPIHEAAAIRSRS